MRRFLGFGIAVLVFTSMVGGGCIFSPEKTDPPPPSGVYKEPTTPENVINNLVVSYTRKESDKYGPLLRHDFIFQFQEKDAQVIGERFWTKDQDSTGTHRLFTANDIHDIRIDLPHGPAKDPTEITFPEGTKHIRVSPTDLEVEQDPDITLVVKGDIQDFFLLKGDADEGENPDHWYILEWRDMGDLSGVGKPGLGGGASEPGTREVTWGEILGLVERR